MSFLIYTILLFSLNYAQFNWQDDGASIRQGLHIEWQRTGDANADGSMVYAWSDCVSLCYTTESMHLCLVILG